MEMRKIFQSPLANHFSLVMQSSLLLNIAPFSANFFIVADNMEPAARQI
jgi:hypothetical protein